MVQEVSRYGEAVVTVPAGQKIAVFSLGPVKVYKEVGYPNLPTALVLDFSAASGSETVSSAYSADTVVHVFGGASPTYYATGASPSINQPTSDISASDATFDITGLQAAQGGYVYVTGGASTTSANAGGEARLVGGAPGATGVGGAAKVLGAAGGATSGAGGAVSITGGAGTAGNSAGGAVTATGGAGQGTAAGGAASVVGGASGAGATGNGGAVNITGGAAASTNGNGGSVVITPGAKSGSGLDGIIRGVGTWVRKMSRATISNAGTVTVAQVAGGVLYQDASGGNVTMTSPTAAAIDAAFPDLATGDGLMLYVASNHATNTSTISGGSNVTLVGSGAVTQLGGVFALIKTGSGAYDMVRVG